MRLEQKSLYGIGPGCKNAREKDREEELINKVKCRGTEEGGPVGR